MPRTVTINKNSRLTVMASVCVVVAALYFAQDVLIPLALAMLLSFLIAPLVARLEHWKLGRVPSVMIVAIVLVALIGVLGYVVWEQVYDLADNVDTYRDNIVAKIEKLPIRGGVFEKLQELPEQVQKKIEPQTQPTSTTWSPENPLPVAMTPPKPSPLQSLGYYAGFALGPLGTFGIVIVFVIFMLLQREDLRNRLIRLMSGGQLTVATTALDDALSRISRYLAAQAFVNGTYGLTIALGLWLIGVTVGRHDPAAPNHFPNVALWGLLCGLLRFIPYIGPWIAAAFPVLISLAVYKGFGVFVAVGSLFIGVELLSNNFMEPWLYGSSTGMSAVAILVSAVFWTWLWGPVGLLLSTPLTVVLVVLGKYVPQLQFLDVLLGDEPVLDPPTRVYQRLLALDAEEATEVLQEYHREMPLEQVYDVVLLPALALAEQDRSRGLLDERRQSFIRRSMREMIEELSDHERIRLEEAAAKEEPQAPTETKANGNGHPAAAAEDEQATKSSKRTKVPRDCTINIVCLPAHDEADEIVDLMLAQLLELRGYCPHSISQTALASEMIGQIEAKHADVVVVSALPPGAVAHARYLCKRVHVRFPDAKMVVGLWNFGGDLHRAKERITCVASVQVVTMLAGMQEQIDQLAQPAIVREAPANRTDSTSNIQH